MSLELILFIAMVAVFAIACFALKLPVSIAMVLSSITATIIAGKGIPIRHLVEGTFGYIDTILVIATAMVFMKVIQEIGTLNALSASILKKFHKTPWLLLILLMFISMFPGMITGSSTASVLTAGSIVAPIFMLIGIPMVETATIIALGGLFGMIAPPVNVPAMIIGGGIGYVLCSFLKNNLMNYLNYQFPLGITILYCAIVILCSVLITTGALKQQSKLSMMEALR